MAQAVPYVLMAGATALSAKGKIDAGKAEAKSASNEARQMEFNAQRRLKEGRSRAEEEHRQTARLMSDAQAVQAASGFSASDAQAVKQRGDIAGAGKYNELAYLYEAQMDSEGILRGAKNTRETGKNLRTASYYGAASTIFSGARSGYDSYKTTHP